MAKSFKQLLGDDVKNTRTLLHEAIPLTGSIVTGTYNDNNIKTFSHGMFESVYDYPYLSSSANHALDITYGVSSNVSSSNRTQNAKKMNIYNQMAQVLLGYDESGSIKQFDSDGTANTAGTTWVGSGHPDSQGIMDEVFFINLSRLLSKDEIKKNTMRLQLFNSASHGQIGTPTGSAITIGDYNAGNEFRSCPAGDYGLLFTSSAGNLAATASVGLIFYQAGIVALTASIFSPKLGQNLSYHSHSYGAANTRNHKYQWVRFGAQNVWPTVDSAIPINFLGTGSVNQLGMSGTIEQMADGFRHRLHDIDFNNTIELNSSIYFCRINHNEFNYSSNPTYVNGSKLVVKNKSTDLPITYITTVGLYSPDNELLAVAKLSEPIRKDPNTELTLRVRLDY